MNTRALWIAALGGAVLTTLAVNLPVIGLVSLLLCVGFWGGAVFAAWLYRRLNGTLTIGEGIRIGALTGLCAGALGFALSFLGLAGLQGLVNEIRLFIPAENLGTISYSLGEVLSFNLAGVVCNVVFGVLGGVIGGAVFRTNDSKSAAVPAV